MTRVIIHGSSGRMGKVLREKIDKIEDMQVVAGIDFIKDDSADFPQFTSPSECSVSADVVIDFSNHAAVPALVDFCCSRNIPAVICTTALTDDCIKQISAASAKTAFFRSANMSLGINAMAKALRSLTPVLEDGYNVEIIEKHHNKKKDSPSGTAVMLADAVNSACKVKKNYVYGRHGKDDDVKITDMGIHSVRGGTIPGEHTVIFAGPDEVIEITHTALSRDIFAEGAIAAAAFLAQKESGIYSMDDII